jgi:hypothetical protein
LQVEGGGGDCGVCKEGEKFTCNWIVIRGTVRADYGAIMEQNYIASCSSS